MEDYKGTENWEFVRFNVTFSWECTRLILEKLKMKKTPYVLQIKWLAQDHTISEGQTRFSDMWLNVLSTTEHCLVNITT